MNQTARPADEDDGDFDLGRFRDWASYVLRAVGRNLFLVLLLATLVVAATKFAVWVIPDQYYVETRLLAQRPDVNAILSSPSALSDPAAATRAVGQMVRRRDNLLALIGQTGLLEHWRTARPRVEELQDRLFLRRPLDDEDLTELLVGKLEDNLAATAKDGVVTISVTWHDPDMAQRLVDAALQNFLETRHVNEMAILGESILLLEERLAEAQRGLDQAMSDVRSLPAPARRAIHEARPLPAVPDEASLELTRLRSTIGAKRRAEQDLVSFRDRRIAELQARLVEQKAIYSESHPVVANIRRSLEALAVDSPQLAALRQELHELEAEYVSKGGTAANLDDRPLTRPAPSTSAPAIIASMESPTRDPSEDYTRSRMATAIARYYACVDRLETVRLERDAARASIKYRYAVVRPPLRPRAPTNRGLKVKLWIAGALGGLGLGVLAAVAREIRRGRIVQRWQVEHGLGLAILAELPLRAALRGQRRSA